MGVHSLSKALTTMRLVSVGSINPSRLSAAAVATAAAAAAAAAPSRPTVSRGKHHGGGVLIWGWEEGAVGSGLERLNLIMD